MGWRQIDQQLRCPIQKEYHEDEDDQYYEHDQEDSGKPRLFRLYRYAGIEFHWIRWFNVWVCHSDLSLASFVAKGFGYKDSLPHVITES